MFYVSHFGERDDVAELRKTIEHTSAGARKLIAIEIDAGKVIDIKAFMNRFISINTDLKL